MAFMHDDLDYFDLEQKILQLLDNSFGTSCRYVVGTSCYYVSGPDTAKDGGPRPTMMSTMYAAPTP